MLSFTTKSKVEDSQVPGETCFYNSIKQSVFLICLLFAWLSVGFFLCIKTWYIPGLLLSAITIFGIFYAIKILFDRTPQLVLSCEGINITKHGFHCWKNIKGEQIIRIGEGKQVKWQLIYYHNSNKVTYDIGWLTIQHQALQSLLSNYREMYNKQCSIQIVNHRLT